MKPLSMIYLAAVFIVGIAVGYFISKANYDQVVSSSRSIQTDQGKSATISSGKRIDSLLADSLIKEYIAQNTADVSPLMTEYGLLKGYFISKSVFETIFKEQQVVGVSLYLAKNPKYREKAKKIYTLVVMGAKLKTQSANGSDVKARSGDGPDYENIEPYFEFVDTCPDKCGDY